MATLIIILDSSFHSPSSSVSSLCEEPMDKSDIQIYVLAEESRTTNSYVIEICSENREGKNKAVGLVIEAGWIFASARNAGMISKPKAVK